MSSKQQLAAAASSITDWISTVLDSKSSRTREGYVYVVRRLWGYLEAHSYPTELHELRPMHLRGFYTAARAGGASANTLANFDRTLRAVFNRIEREGLEDFDLPASWTSPLRTVEKLRAVEKPKPALSAVQAAQLLAAAPRQGVINYRNYAELGFMLMTGARSIEVRYLQVADIDLTERVALLRVAKGNKPRVVFLPQRLVRVLGNWLRRRSRNPAMAGSQLLFPTRSGGVQSRRAVHRSVRAAGKRIGLPDVHPHRLRRAYVTLSHARGAPLKFLQEQCGHRSVAQTEQYIALSAEQKAELAERFASV